MNNPRMRLFDDIPFHTFLPWYLLKLSALLFLGLLCLWLALHVHLVWAFGVLSSLSLAVASAVRFPIQAIIVRSTDVVFRDGILWISERRVPLEHVALHIEQSRLGRVLDYGTIRHHLRSQIIVIHDVANIRMLQWLLSERQHYLARAQYEHRWAQTRQPRPVKVPLHDEFLCLPSSHQANSCIQAWNER